MATFSSRRRAFMGGVLTAVCGAPGVSFSAPKRKFRIGYLAIQEKMLKDGPNPVYEAFMKRMRELGWTPGDDRRIEYYASNGVDARFQRYADELVQGNVDVIVTNNTASTLAAMNATKKIPIVFGSAADPVTQLMVSGYSRPGNNVTGLAILVPELNVKRLEILKDLDPSIRRVGVMFQSGSISSMQQKVERYDAAASKSLKLDLEQLWVSDQKGLEGAVLRAREAGASALRVSNAGLFVQHRDEIAHHAIRARLPLIGPDDRFADAGALLAYGENFPQRYRKAAELVDKVLRGLPPSELPVELPDSLELVVNSRTASAIGVQVSTKIMRRAKRVTQ